MTRNMLQSLSFIKNFNDLVKALAEYSKGKKNLARPIFDSALLSIEFNCVSLPSASGNAYLVSYNARSVSYEQRTMALVFVGPLNMYIQMSPVAQHKF
jgi:hypothetical protein